MSIVLISTITLWTVQKFYFLNLNNYLFVCYYHIHIVK